MQTCPKPSVHRPCCTSLLTGDLVLYLWIDSLCIVQDSTKDWRRECSKMHLVYEHFICTLSAAGASDGTESLFAVYPLHLPQHIYLPKQGIFWLYRVNTLSPEEDARRQWISSNPQANALSTYENLSSQALAQRALVFQENDLSFRNLHFSLQGLV